MRDSALREGDPAYVQCPRPAVISSAASSESHCQRRRSATLLESSSFRTASRKRYEFCRESTDSLGDFLGSSSLTHSRRGRQRARSGSRAAPPRKEPSASAAVLSP